MRADNWGWVASGIGRRAFRSPLLATSARVACTAVYSSALRPPVGAGVHFLHVRYGVVEPTRLTARACVATHGLV